jgi:hypothetical protein
LEFHARPFELSVLGKPRLMKFFQAVKAHLDEKHADYLAAATIAVYTTEDPALVRIAESARGQVNAASRKNTASDAQITDRFAGAGFTQEELSRLIPLVREMRDYLSEAGKYAPPAPPPL